MSKGLAHSIRLGVIKSLLKANSFFIFVGANTIIMKLALAFDSFKGSLTSKEVADAFSEGIRSVMPDSEFIKFYISDGGEGFIEALQHDKAYELVSVAAHDPLMRPIDSVYLIDNKRKSAVIDLANVCGLTLLTAQERNPLHTSTYGV